MERSGDSHMYVLTNIIHVDIRIHVTACFSALALTCIWG